MSLSPVIFKDPQIYFPNLFQAVSKSVPHLAMTSKEAVAAGFSFRKKRRSVKITKYRGKAQMQLHIPYTIDGMPVDEIRANTFWGRPCNTVFLHGNLRKLGKSAFQECTVKTLIIEDGLTSLPAYAFHGCKSLEEVRLPLTIKHIGLRCFRFCTGLKYIEFPKSISDIEDQAFHGTGLDGFAVEALTPGISNADAFTETPVLDNNQVVCTYPDHENLTVLHVNGPYAKYDSPFRFRQDSVTFCRWSLRSFHIDLSACKKVRFYRDAIRRKRERDSQTHTYVIEPCLMILPESEESKQHFAFPKNVTVTHYFPDRNRPYNGPVEIDYDDHDNSCVVTPVADFLPAWTVKEDWDKLRITGRPHIDRNAVSIYDLCEITFEDFCPEDTVFSLYCYALRKVSFGYKGKMYTKYIPPIELVNTYVHTIMTLSFTSCKVPSGNGFRHTVYNRQMIDSIFPHRRISSDNNMALAMLRDRDHMSWGESHWKRKFYLTVTNSIKALIAVDVLRSDRLDHEPPVDMYLSFLKKHRRYCAQYFQKISGKYPEYLQAFEEIMQDADSMFFDRL